MVIIGKQRSHTIALNFHRLINKNEADCRDAGNESASYPNPGTAPRLL